MTMTDFIADDLIARTRAGSPPDDLTLQGIADLYGVSLTPARQAVARLVEERFLLKGTNGRLEINRRKVGRGKPSKPARPECPQDLHYRVLDWVVSQSFSGETPYLRESTAAEALDLGRGTVREAFSRLDGSTLEHVPRHGWRVRPFRHEDLEHFLRAREALELVVLDEAWPHLEDAELRRMLDGNVVPKSKGARIKIDNGLHAYLIERSGNLYVKDFFSRHLPYFEMIFAWESFDRAAATEAAEQHREILKALLARDRKKARAALSHHSRTNHPVLNRIGVRAK